LLHTNRNLPACGDVPCGLKRERTRRPVGQRGQGPYLPPGVPLVEGDGVVLGLLRAGVGVVAMKEEDKEGMSLGCFGVFLVGV
jgi:hypothetical protein